jgi:hypothetical protein
VHPEVLADDVLDAEDRHGRQTHEDLAHAPRWLVSNGVRLREDRQAEGH